MQLYVQVPESLLKFSFHLPVKISLPANWNFPGKIADKYKKIYSKGLEKFKHSDGSKLVSKILCCAVLVYNSYIFQNSRFTEIIRHKILKQTL